MASERNYWKDRRLWSERAYEILRFYSQGNSGDVKAQVVNTSGFPKGRAAG